MYTAEQIFDLLKFGEHLTLECKKAEHGIPNSVWETYSAFANTNGGVILLGVEEINKENDLDKRFVIASIDDHQSRLNDFWNLIHNPSKVNVNILQDSNVGTCVIDGKTIIWIEVPQADYTQKPVYINGNPISGTYKRDFEGDYHCKENEIKAMFRDSSDDGNDGGLLDGYTMDDIDPETLKAYRMRFVNKNPDHVWNKDDDKTFLRELGAYVVDVKTKREGLTTAGLLMFGKGLPIRDRFDNIRLDYFDKTNLVGDMRWSDRLTYDGTWENNLCNFLWMVLPKLTRDIKKPFKLEGMTRIDDTPVHKAIRESMINMLIHSDYMITGVLKVVKEDNAFLFSNPGGLKIPIRKIYEGGNSKARNPRIQTMLRMIGYGDNAGSGFPTILDAWKGEKWRMPDLNEDAELHQVDLRLFTISLMPEECTIYLSDLLGKKTYQLLASEEQIILGTAYLENSVSNQRMQQILDLHPTDIGKLLSGLVDKEILLSERRGRWTTYKINKDYKKPSIQDKVTEDGNPNVTFKNETDKIIYEYICSNGFITTKQIVDSTIVGTSQGASVALKRLIDMKLIKKQGKGYLTRYILVKNSNSKKKNS